MTDRTGSPRLQLAAYALLAGVGALQWARYVEGATAVRPLLWVLAGTLTAALVQAAGRLPGRRAPVAALAAALGGLVLAVAVSGLDLRELWPRRWDDLAAGVAQGAEALNSVRLPYLGSDPWVLASVDLAGAALCWGAAVAAAWPRPADARPGTARLIALTLLLVLAASPVVSIGTEHPVALGLALAVLVAAFLWAERIARPGAGLAALAAAALLVAVPLGAAADREEPWFDYKAFSENFAGGRPITYDWDHGYGPIDWPREGAEILRVRSEQPLYWKAEVLGGFDGRQWGVDSRSDGGGDQPVDDLPRNWRRHPGWNATLSFSLKRLRTPTLVGAGTVLSVRDATQAVEPDLHPGSWLAAGGGTLGAGDSYTVRAHVPRPSPAQLQAATVGRDRRRAGYLRIHVAFRPDALAGAPLTPAVPGRPQRPIDEADVSFAPFEAGSAPTAHYRLTGLDGDGADALERSPYDRTWALARRLRERAGSPYDYVLRVNELLRGPGFRYSEVPPRPARGEAPLESFLFDGRLGYCQQYSGAMALLLRMGGIPARVATGFSPGGLRRSTGEWVVRDTDAHSWVEAWFDGIGWVTFDPTPAQTPARSLVAAIATPSAPRPGPSATPDASGRRPRARSPEGLTREPSQPAARRGGAGVPWPPIAAGAAALVLAAALLARRRALARGAPPAERALHELERALRRSGRSAPPGTTLAALERRLGTSGEGSAYLQALRRARYGAGAEGPTPAQRAAFRRELASGLGWRGRLVALWALPPRPGVPGRRTPQALPAGRPGSRGLYDSPRGPR